MAEQPIDIEQTTAYIANTVTYAAGLPILDSLRAKIGGETTLVSDVSYNGVPHNGGGAFRVRSTAVAGGTDANNNTPTPFLFVSEIHTNITPTNSATYHMTVQAESTDEVSTGFDVMFYKTLDVADSVALLNGFDVSGVKIIKADNDAPTATFGTDAIRKEAAVAVLMKAIDGTGTAALDGCGNTMSAFLAHDLNNQLLKLFGRVSTVGGVDSSDNLNNFNTDYEEGAAADINSLIKDDLELIIQVDASSSSVTLDSSSAVHSVDASDNSWDPSGATQLLREIPYANLNLYDSSNNLTTVSLPLKTGDTIVLVFDTDPSGIYMSPTQSRGIQIDGNPNAGENFTVGYTPVVRRLGLALTVTSGKALNAGFDVDPDGRLAGVLQGGEVVDEEAAAAALALLQAQTDY
jgi:hypothetical protein